MTRNGPRDLDTLKPPCVPPPHGAALLWEQLQRGQIQDFRNQRRLQSASNMWRDQICTDLSQKRLDDVPQHHRASATAHIPATPKARDVPGTCPNPIFME